MIYDVANGDRGRCLLDGQEVDAVRCSPDEGWADCFRPDGEGGIAINGDYEPVIDRKHGRVEFHPEARS